MVRPFYRLIGDSSNKVRYWVTVSFDVAYPFIPNRKQAWFVFHKLAEDWDGDIRANATLAIGSTFTYILNEEQALEDLIRLTQDDESNVRINANHFLVKRPYSRQQRHGVTWSSGKRWKTPLDFLRDRQMRWNIPTHPDSAFRSTDRFTQ